MRCNAPLPASATRRAMLAAAAAMAAAPLTGTRAADVWPSKPIRLVHAFAAGSVTDNTGRMLADRLGQSLGQPVVVENRPGANMIIGSEFAAKQPADGHTMIIGTCDNMAINPNVYRNPGYRAADFDPVTLIGPLPMTLLVPADSRFNSLADVKAEFARSRKPPTFGTWGVGSFAHMVGELIRMETGVGLEYVPFQGAAPAMTALLGGHIDMTINGSGAAADLLAGKKAKALAIGSPVRLPELPAVPTFAELGHPNLRATQWHGVFVRAGGNKEIIDRLYREVARALNDARSREQLMKAGYSRVDARSPAEFARFIDDEVALWGRIVKQSGISAER